MAVLGRLRLGSAERLDLPDLLSIDSFVAGDFKYLIQSFIGAERPYILKGFDVIQPQDSINTESISIRLADSVVYYPSSLAGSFFYGLEEGNINAQPLVPELRKNATNFVYLTLTTSDTARDSRAFWDPDQNGGEGGEFSQDINTESVLEVQVGVSVSTFPEGTVPVCKVKVGPSIIESIEDARDMMFRLGTGGVSPDPFADYNFRNDPGSEYSRNEPSTIMTSALDANPFQGGDKNIFTLKEWMDVVMTRIKEISGDTYWYSTEGGGATPPNISDTWHDALGSTLKSKGEWVHDETTAGQLTWTEDIQYHNLTDPRVLVFRDSIINIANDNEVAYVEIVRDVEINNSATAVRWKNGSNIVNSPDETTVGAFENLAKGDWIKKKSDEHYRYLRVEAFGANTGGIGGGETTAALAKSVVLSDNYAGTTGTDIGDYTKGEYLSTDIQINDRANPIVHDTGGNFFWLAYRSDTVLGLQGITPTQLTVDITEADGVRAKCTSVGHGLVDGDRIQIIGGTGYAGEHKVSVEDTDIFYINTTNTGDEAEQTAFYAVVETRARDTGVGDVPYDLESANHGFQSDQRVFISDTLSAYDGDYLVNVRSDTTFNIPIGSLIADPGIKEGEIVRLARVNVKTEFGLVKVVQGTSIDIGDPDTSNILSFVGMDSLAQTKPVYNVPSDYNALDGFQNYNSGIDDDLTLRVSRLTSMMADRVQERGFSIRGRVNITSVTNGGNKDISATGLLTLHKPSSLEQTIDLTVSLPANSVAVANIDRNGGSAITLSVESLGSQFLLEENKIIMFYRFAGDTVYTWRDEALEPSGHLNTEQPEDSQNRNVSIFNPGIMRLDVASGLLEFEIVRSKQVTEVVVKDGSSVPQSSYFVIWSAKDVTQYYVWYNVDGGGVDPAPGGTGIQVAISSGDTDIQVADATVLAINTSAGADFTADNSSGTSATVSIENDAIGECTAPSDGGTTFTISTPTAGQDPDPEIIINGATNYNTIDSDTINGLGTLVLSPEQSAWVRVNRFAQKTFNTVLTSDTPDTDVAGAIYVTDIVDVPIDQDVFVLWMRRGDNLIEYHKATPPDSNIYEETITVVSGPAANDNEIQGPISAGTIITLPLDSRDGDSGQYYIVGAGQLRLDLNGQVQRLDEDWSEIGAGATQSNRIQIDRPLVVGDKLQIRLDAQGAVYFASAGLIPDTLQNAYDNGRFITINSGQPVVISGPASEKLFTVLGDIDVTGVIDPTGLQFTPVAANPLSGFGLWTENVDNDLVYEGGAFRAAGLKLNGFAGSWTGDPTLAANGEIEFNPSYFVIQQDSIPAGDFPQYNFALYDSGNASIYSDYLQTIEGNSPNRSSRITLTANAPGSSSSITLKRHESGGANDFVQLRSGTADIKVQDTGLYISGVTNQTFAYSLDAVIATESNNANDSIATGDLTLSTGDKTLGTGNSGNLNLETGTSTGGSRGGIYLKDGSEGVPGSVWTHGATAGAGSWQLIPIGSWTTSTVAGAGPHAVSNYDEVFVDTFSAPATVNLPAATKGLRIRLIDDQGTWSTNSVTVNANGADTFDGVAGPLTLNIDDKIVELLGDTNNWRVVVLK